MRQSKRESAVKRLGIVTAALERQRVWCGKLSIQLADVQGRLTTAEARIAELDNEREEIEAWLEAVDRLTRRSG